MEENAQLRGELQRVVRDQRSKSTVNVEARLQAFQYENERDQIYEQLEKMKRKYNQLHQAFVAKVKRCKALEDVFNRQKTLNGLVLKSETAQRQKGDTRSIFTNNFRRIFSKTFISRNKETCLLWELKFRQVRFL